MPPKLVIFDVDGTLVQTRSGATFRELRACGDMDRHGRLYSAHTTAEEDWEWLPGRLEHLRSLAARGIRIAFVSNQGGVTLGFLREQALGAVFDRMAMEVTAGRRVPAGYTVAILYCTYLPGTSPDDAEAAFMRKPKPGMLLEACLFFDIPHHHALMVGDRPEDEAAAQAAGIPFQWAAEYFGGL